MPAGTTVSLKLLIQATNKASKQVGALQHQINEVTKAAVGLATSSKKAGSQGAAAMGKFEKGVTSLRNRLDQVNSSLEGVGTTGAWLVGIAASLAGMAFFPIKAASDFQHEMSAVKAVTAGATERFEELTNVASELGRTTMFTAKQAAEGMVFLGMAGMDAQEVIEAIGPALTLAAAAGIDLAQAADIVTNVVSAMRVPIEDLGDAADILANTTANANTNLLQLADGMKYAGPLAAAAGVSLTEVASVMGVLGNNGIQASMAGTAVRGMLRSIAAPTSAAKEVLEKLNIEIKTNADGSIELIKVLHDLAEAQLTTAEANKLFGRFAAAGALAVTANIEQLDELIISNRRSAGSAKRMAKIMKDNVEGSFIIMTSALDGFKRAMAGPLLDTIKTLIRALTGILTITTEFVEAFPVITAVLGTLMLGVIALTGSLGGLALALATVSSVAGATSKALGVGLAWQLINAAKLIKATTIATMVYSGANTLLAKSMIVLRIAMAKVLVVMKALWASMLAHPVLWVLAAIGLLMVALASWAQKNRTLISTTKKLAAEMRGLYKNFAHFTNALEDLEGTEEYAAAMANMRTKLLETAKAHEELKNEAKAAALSIDENSGKLLDAGKALDAYKEKLKDVGLDAMKGQIVGLNIELDRLNVGTQGVISEWNDLVLGAKTVWAALTPGSTVMGVWDEHIEKVNLMRQEIKLAYRNTIQYMTAMESFDMTMTLSEAASFFEIVGGYSKKISDDMVQVFSTMQGELSAVKKAVKDVADATTDELKQSLISTGEEAERTATVLDKIAKKTRELSAEWKQLSEEQKLDQEDLRESIELAHDARQKVVNQATELEKKKNEVIKALRASALQDAKEGYDKELADLVHSKKLKKIQEWEYQLDIAKINRDYAETRLAALMEVDNQIIASGSAETEEAKKTAKAIKALLKASKEANIKFNDSRILEAHRVADQILQINRQAQKKVLALGPMTIDRINKEADLEIEVLKETLERKGINQKGYSDLVVAINKERDVDIRKFRIGQTSKLNQEQLSLAKQLNQNELELIERQYKDKEIGVEEYTQKVLALQTAVIDMEIAILQAKLEELRQNSEDNPIIQVLEIQQRTLEAKKAGIVAGDPQAGKAIALEAQRQQLLVESMTLKARMDILRSGVATQQEIAKQELAIYKNTEEQKALMAEAAKMGDEELAAYKILLANETANQMANNEKKVSMAQMNWQAQQAGRLSDIFGDMYEMVDKKQKAWFYLQKAAAIAQIVISTRVAAMKVLDQLGIWGKIEAALIYAQGAMSIAKVTSTNLAKGGEVPGRSPHKRADNIPVNATAGEWVLPIDSVKMYGRRVMEGLRQRLIPPNLFDGYRLPVPAYATSVPRRTGYAAGGAVEERRFRSVGKEAQKAPEINIVNVVDPTELDRYLSTSSGQNAILNVLSSRKEFIRRILK